MPQVQLSRTSDTRQSDQTYSNLRPALAFGLADLQSLKPASQVALAYAALMQACSTPQSETQR